MTKISIFLLSIGSAIGFFLGGVATYAAWDLNPQMEYTLNPEGLIVVFLSWFLVALLPFCFFAGVREFLKRHANTKKLN